MSPYGKRVIYYSLFGWMLLFAQFAPPPQAAGDVGSIHGRVAGPDGQGKSGVAVHLRNSITGFLAEATTGAEGGFDFRNVPFNPYLLQIEVADFQLPIDRLEPRTPIP